MAKHSAISKILGRKCSIGRGASTDHDVELPNLIMHFVPIVRAKISLTVAGRNPIGQNDHDDTAAIRERRIGHERF